MVKKSQQKLGRWHVMHLTPCEAFVWNKLRENAKEVDGQLRIAIPADREDLYLSWDPSEDMQCDENSLHRIVQRFCSAGIIARVGENSKGFIPHIMSDSPGTFHVNHIKSRPQVGATPEMIQLAQALMEEKYHENPHKGFTAQFHKWIEQNSTVKPSTAHVKLVGVRAGNAPAIGVLFQNPEWVDATTPGRRYLIAVPGFTAYELVPEIRKNIRGKRAVEVQTNKRQSAIPPTASPDENASRPANPIANMDLDGMQKLIANLKSNINELKTMLMQKERDLLTAEQTLDTKLDEAIKTMALEQVRLQTMRDKLQQNNS
jgi:hypothetical protein